MYTTNTDQKFPEITRAHAMMVENQLVGFYASETLVDEQELEAFVRQHLPYYSVPEGWKIMSSVPLTPNGKVDRKELSKMAISHESLNATTDLSAPPPAALPPAKHAVMTTVRELDQSTPSPSEATTDLEKGEHRYSNRYSNRYSKRISRLSMFSVWSNVNAVPNGLPAKNGFHGQRWMRHRLFILYRRFFSVVMLTNLAVAGFILYRKIKQDRLVLADIAVATSANLCVAILMRSEPVINLLFTVFCSVPTWLPLSIRRHCARIFHIGGIHSGCALASIMWFSIFTIAATVEYNTSSALKRISLPTLVLSYFIWVIFLAMASMSHPDIRAKYHNAWEMTHRFGGWTCLILLWIQTFLATKDLNPYKAPSKAYLNSPPVWLITIATMAIIFPWLFLRKVPVRSEVLSKHAVRLWFDYTTPVVGTAVRLAEHPLIDWHGFATITNEGPNPKGFSLIVSRAGDFTGRMIERAPTHIWVRGIPACGVLRIATLFRSVVLVATGSGIGPCLAVILANKTPCRILWTAPNPEQTFGQEIVDSVQRTDPHAVIHNTRTMGKPNMSLMAYNLWKESGAEAVCVISNKKFTTKIVYDMEARGIPAYGAIFDS